MEEDIPSSSSGLHMCACMDKIACMSCTCMQVQIHKTKSEKREKASLRVTPELGRLKQENLKFRTSLGYTTPSQKRKPVNERRAGYPWDQMFMISSTYLEPFPKSSGQWFCSDPSAFDQKRSSH